MRYFGLAFVALGVSFGLGALAFAGESTEVAAGLLANGALLSAGGYFIVRWAESP
ncbi:MAG TPA: hypothetical protein VNN77_00035 [candidate division Zixibacteria bacterium]|nr:hypothetical protein [candidate division Zixibacteria bacterium]